jgi:hypothetical protein
MDGRNCFYFTKSNINRLVLNQWLLLLPMTQQTVLFKTADNHHPIHTIPKEHSHK